MLINLTDNFKHPEKTGKYVLQYGEEKFSLEGTDYPVNFGEGVEITIKTIGNGRLEITGEGEAHTVMPCDRCLTDVNVTIPVEVEVVVTEPDGFKELSEDNELYMSGYELDGDAILHNELIMGLPMKVLCKDDCKGLCPVCGSNRNEGECGCDTFVPDPRMAAIQDIFNANK